jgi:hypothetical protein
LGLSRLKFEITSHSVKLHTEEDYPELKDLREKDWSPSGILY